MPVTAVQALAVKDAGYSTDLCVHRPQVVMERQFLQEERPFGADADQPVLARLEAGAEAAVDRGGEDPAVLMVCMIAGKLGPARCKERFCHFLAPFHLTDFRKAYTTKP